jgi:predicted lysophospholipase L1 biosynthesis ABC-type transport system permease subunit
LLPPPADKLSFTFAEWLTPERERLRGMAIGVLVSLLFSVVPLLHVRFIKPSLLLRDESVRRARDWAGMAVIAVVSLALVALTAWQALFSHAMLTRGQRVLIHGGAGELKISSDVARESDALPLECIAVKHGVDAFETAKNAWEAKHG